jgi:hypothetical protein
MALRGCQAYLISKPSVWKQPDTTTRFLWADPPDGSGRFNLNCAPGILPKSLKRRTTMTDKNKGSHDQDYASAADPASTGQKTQKVSLWQWPLIPADDPIYKAGSGPERSVRRPCRDVCNPRKFTLVNWEDRPAVLTGWSAFAIVSKGGSWVSVDFAEVVDSGGSISAEAFANKFPYADLDTVPTSSVPEATTPFA